MYQVTRAESWWILAIAGVVNVLFGVTALLWPGLTLSTLVWLFGVFAIVYGVVELLNVFGKGSETPWWVHLMLGVFSVLAGIVVFAWPGLTAVTLAYVIAVWAIAIGTAEIVGAFLLNRLYLAIAGLLAVLFGLLLLMNPLDGALALIVMIGVFAIVRGIVQLVMAATGMTMPAVR